MGAQCIVEKPTNLIQRNLITDENARDEGRYIGATQNGVREGQGKCNYKNGAVYEGYWLNNKPEGNGVKNWPDGRIFEGSWHLGLPHGRGKLTYKSGSSYIGEFDQNIKKGQGQKFYNDGRFYEGQWDDDCCGQGVMTWPHGAKYTGGFLNGVHHGNGEKTWSDRSKYQGEWQKNKQQGNGKMFYANGEYYEGEWNKGLQQGHGVLEYPDGKVYTGGWIENQKSGEGEFRWASGSFYVGNFKRDKRNGFGKFVDEDNQVQEGQWYDDQFVGQQQREVGLPPQAMSFQKEDADTDRDNLPQIRGRRQFVQKELIIDQEVLGNSMNDDDMYGQNNGDSEVIHSERKGLEDSQTIMLNSGSKNRGSRGDQNLAGVSPLRIPDNSAYKQLDLTREEKSDNMNFHPDSTGFKVSNRAADQETIEVDERQGSFKKGTKKFDNQAYEQVDINF